MASSASSYLCNFRSFLPLQHHLTPIKPQPTSIHIHNIHERDHDPFSSLTSKTTTFPTVQLTSHSSSFRSLLLPQTSLEEYHHMDFDVMETAFPALALANVCWYKSGYYNVQTVVVENESEESLMRRFRKEVFKAGILPECRRRRYFEDNVEKKKRKTKELAKKNGKRRPWQKNSVSEDKGSKDNKVEVEEEDNWELPEGKIPYCWYTHH